MTSRLNRISVVGAVVGAGIGGWLLAGDIDPPAGPLQPTMRTLDEVYAAIENLAASDPCAICPWEYKRAANIDGLQQVLGFHALIHGFWLDAGTTTCELFDGDPRKGGRSIVLLHGDGSENRFIELNVIVNELWISVYNGYRGTALYRPMP